MKTGDIFVREYKWLSSDKIFPHKLELLSINTQITFIKCWNIRCITPKNIKNHPPIPENIINILYKKVDVTVD